MTSSVRTFTRTRRSAAGDEVVTETAPIWRERVHLKLAALAYDGSRVGADSGPGFAWDALVLGCVAAHRYAHALRGTENPGPLLDRTLSYDNAETPTTRTRAYESTSQARLDRHVEGARKKFQFTMIAYAQSRHGADMCQGFSGEALRVLCQVAIDYIEATELTDPSHLLDDAKTSR